MAVTQVDESSQENVFSWLDRLVQNAGDANAAFERLVERLRSEKQYRQLFDARLMKKRWELGLPLVTQPTIAELPKEVQQAYQDGYVQAATEVGELYLADGDIPRAWTYFRALGNTKPVAEALETFAPSDSDSPEAQDLLGSTIQLAFQEGVNPRKGFELILQHYGMCRAITMFSSYPHEDGRDESLRLLVRSLHGELVNNLKRAISSVEGKVPEGNAIPALIAGRDWLFENNAQHTDSSHIVSLLKLSGDLEDRESLKLAIEIADYGTQLGPMFQYQEDPPFDRVYEDRGTYLRALLGENVDAAVSHFEEKAERFDPERYGNGPAEVLVELFIRLGRFDEAIRIFRRYLMNFAPEDLSCPSLLQLCQMAGDFEQLRQVAQQQSDPLSYMAALLQTQRETRRTNTE
jgi:tetratricopeptide (TPR) repeat protein